VALLLRLFSSEEERSSAKEGPSALAHSCFRESLAIGMAISSASEAERMVWQMERMDERGRLARDWHQLLALYGFMALYGFLLLLFGSLWLSRLFMAQIPQKSARLDPPGHRCSREREFVWYLLTRCPIPFARCFALRTNGFSFKLRRILYLQTHANEGAALRNFDVQNEQSFVKLRFVRTLHDTCESFNPHFYWLWLKIAGISLIARKLFRHKFFSNNLHFMRECEIISPSDIPSDKLNFILSILKFQFKFYLGEFSFYSSLFK
jgi:hypothetical protein